VVVLALVAEALVAVLAWAAEAIGLAVEYGSLFVREGTLAGFAFGRLPPGIPFASETLCFPASTPFGQCLRLKFSPASQVSLDLCPLHGEVL